MSAKYQSSARDLTDAALVDAFLRVQITCSSLGSTDILIKRFGLATAYHGAADAEKINQNVFHDQRERLGELRTISQIQLAFRDLENDSLQINFERASKPTIKFSPLALVNAEQAAQHATSQAQSVPRNTDLQKAAQEATQKVTKLIAKQIPQLLSLVSAANECGLVAATTTDDDPKQEGAAAIRALTERIAELQTTIRSPSRTNEETRKQLIQEYDSRTEQLRKEYQERFERLKGDHKVWEEDIRQRTTEKEQEIAQRAHDVSERENAIDLRNERETRRKLRDEILEKAKAMFEKPDLSKDAKASFEKVERACRWTIGGAVGVLLIAFLIPPILEIYGVSLSSEIILLTWSIRVLGGITLASTLIYYVGSLSAWSKQVNAIELRSKQFALDIDRASWLVEMALEYEKEGKTLPSNLVDSFSRGLFEGGSSGSREPASPLVHLLHNLDTLKIGAGGSEMTITGKQLRKVDAQASKDA